MKKLDGKIGGREFASIVILTIGIKAADTTPTLLFEGGQQATWMIPLFCFLTIIIPFLFLLRLLKKFEDKGLIDIIYNITGKYVGFVIGMILFVLMVIGSSLNSRSYIDIISVLFYPTTPLPFIYFCLMLTAYFVANRGLQAIGRTAWLILPLVKLALLLLVVFVWWEVEFANLFPLEGPGLDAVAIQGAKFSSILSELIFLGVLYPFIRSFQTFKKAGWFGIVFSVVEISLFIALFIMVFSYPSIHSIAFPFQTLTQMAEVTQIVDHTESFYLIFWVVGSVIHFSIYLYVTTAVFTYTLKLKEPEPLIMPMAGLVLLVGMLPQNLSQTILITRENFLYVTSVVVFVLPIFLWSVDWIKGRTQA
ncbi:endospore germination permease [Halobacillus trueperi]|uniref:GerAB/ArcD/ProY family transporter n=1 Tax=Halobacillus trueperi TaxID=156205 RepID=UPI003736E925